MGKRAFQILDDMNEADIVNGTKTVRLGNQVLTMNLRKDHGEITFGIDLEAYHDALNSNYRALILLVDGDEFDKRSEE